MSSAQKQFDLHWLTGQFRDPDKESDYRSSIKTRVRHESRLAWVLIAIVFGMFTITDYSLLGLTGEYYLLASMRAVVVSLCLVLALVLGRRGDYNRNRWLHLLPLLIVATGILLIVPLRPESLSSQVTAAAVAVLAFFLLIPNLLTVAALGCLYLSVGFIAAVMLFTGLSPAEIVRIVLLLIMANIVGYCALLRLEFLQRKQFALLHEERQQNRDLVAEIAHRKSLEAQLRMVAERDALTGLDSRSYFMKRAEGLLQRSCSEKTPFCLFMIDVDHFKSINDTWGHTRGDLILTKIAEVCAQSLRPTDVIGRFGGEEFIVGLPQTSPADAQVIAERLKMKVAELPEKEDMGDLNLSVTVGIAVAHDDDVDLEALITRADKMLYAGKREGRNRVIMCEQGR
ncbi:diguanylate cyclase [Pseudidiomarina sp. 1APR75-15]|uniref:diguanylate cyclase n=1 Tax=Pseudidiomarina terrestris TaxID=2820060 RepID=A0ABT8MJ28_9GAMM|nr:MULTISPECIES: diguanylate cyclase [unclassified Pseudidiomarina]MDN7129954.1 diguanylate cyclase [Pseudidiomarina sp. 1APR75-15]MDN7138355.1 diguanylate cyclase [Pseudidiomarina sp. 1ASP75-14]